MQCTWRAVVLAALALGPCLAQAADGIDLREFKPDHSSGSVELEADRAVLMQTTHAGDAFPGQANIFHRPVERLKSFEYRVTGTNSIASVATNERVTPLAVVRGTGFSTYRFKRPFSGTLAFAIEGMGGHPKKVEPGSGTLEIRKLVQAPAGSTRKAPAHAQPAGAAAVR